jgi:predicted ATP-dependent endonuclease of OLD family
VPDSIKKIRIERFAGIADGTVEPVKQVNILVGRNNSGKSTILDALRLASTPNPELLDLTGRNPLGQVMGRRPRATESPAPYFWYRRDRSQPIQIVFTFGAGNQQGGQDVELIWEGLKNRPPDASRCPQSTSILRRHVAIRYP